MPAAGEELAMTKLVSVHPGNPARGLPTLLGEVVVLDARRGERLALLDGPLLTARRTAALSLLAARTLAPDPAGPLLVVGAGVEGRSHLEAFRQGLGTRRAWVASRTRERAEALAAHGRELGLDCAAVAAPGEVLARAALVVTATTSAHPGAPPGAARGRPAAGLLHRRGGRAHSPGEAEIPRIWSGPAASTWTSPKPAAPRPATSSRPTWTVSTVTPLADAWTNPARHARPGAPSSSRPSATPSSTSPRRSWRCEPRVAFCPGRP
jgi:hypothetical protein